MSDYFERLARQIKEDSDLVEEIESYLCGQLDPDQEIGLLLYIRKGAGRDTFERLWNEDDELDELSPEQVQDRVELLLELAYSKLTGPESLQALGARDGVPPWLVAEAGAFASAMRDGAYFPARYSRSWFAMALSESPVARQGATSWSTLVRESPGSSEGVSEVGNELLLSLERQLHTTLNVFSAGGRFGFSRTVTTDAGRDVAERELSRVAIKLTQEEVGRDIRVEVTLPWRANHCLMITEFSNPVEAQGVFGAAATYLERDSAGSWKARIPRSACNLLLSCAVKANVLLFEREALPD